MMSTSMIVAGIPCLIGLIFCITSLIIYTSNKKKIDNCDVTTMASIVDYEKRKTKDLNTSGVTGVTVMYAPVYEYFINSQAYRVASHVAYSDKKWEIGTRVEVKYNSENPKQLLVMQTQGTVKLLYVLFGILGLILLAIGIIVFFMV